MLAHFLLQKYFSFCGNFSIFSITLKVVKHFSHDTLNDFNSFSFFSFNVSLRLVFVLFFISSYFGLEKKWGGYMDRNISKIKYEYELEINNKRYKILKKLPIPKYEEIDKRFCISYDNKNMSGVYIIQKEDDVYIGQTNNFYKRFMVHRGGYNKTSEKTKILLENGARET
jgi:hypothetical protein